MDGLMIQKAWIESCDFMQSFLIRIHIDFSISWR
jgi:hypothetical protein